jgi:hypothetical protein
MLVQNMDNDPNAWMSNDYLRCPIDKSVTSDEEEQDADNGYIDTNSSNGGGGGHRSRKSGGTSRAKSSNSQSKDSSGKKLLNVDYFRKEDVLALHNKEKHKVYPNLKSLQTELIDLMNDKHGAKVYKFDVTEKYLRVLCSGNDNKGYKRCIFQMWYNFGRDSRQEITNIQWFRSINQSHLLPNH